MSPSRALVLAAVLAVGPPAGAADAADPPPALLEAIQTLLPGATADRIAATPLPGVYEVSFGPNVVYISEDGRYMLRGDLFDLEKRENLTKTAKRAGRLEAIERMGESSMIVFSPEKVKHTITVFTDVDCPYCAKLHQHMSGYNALGIKVRYLAFPRAGIPSPSYTTTVSVWCADDPHVAIGAAKRGEPIEPRECANPVARHYRLGQEIGISGTPAIVLDNGDLVPGYVPPAELAKILDGQGSG